MYEITCNECSNKGNKVDDFNRAWIMHGFYTEKVGKMDKTWQNIMKVGHECQRGAWGD